jgi:hypothetical protein
MKTLLVSAAVLGLTASASLAAESGPLLLTEDQMDGVTAGVATQEGLINVGDVGVAVPIQADVCVIVRNCTPQNSDQRVGRVGGGRPPG